MLEFCTMAFYRRQDIITGILRFSIVVINRNDEERCFGFGKEWEHVMDFAIIDSEETNVSGYPRVKEIMRYMMRKFRDF